MELKTMSKYIAAFDYIDMYLIVLSETNGRWMWSERLFLLQVLLEFL